MARVHYAWVVAGVAFATLVAAAAFRAAPGPLMVPLHEGGWSIVTMSAAVSVNLVLYGLIAPFAAALMERFGLRRVVSAGLLLIAAGSGLSVLARAAWQLVLTWGVLIGLGTGSMALVFAATVANAWFVKRRGLVMGILTAGGAAGQLVFLPVVAYLVEATSWKIASLPRLSRCCRWSWRCFVTARPISGWHPTAATVRSYHQGRFAGARQAWRWVRCVRLLVPRRSGRWLVRLRSAGRRRTG
jgi:MFS family permease